MTADELKDEFEKLTARAKRAGLLKAVFPAEGIAILEIPPQPPAAPAAASADSGAAAGDAAV